MNSDLSYEKIREILSYDPFTGICTWRIDRRGGKNMCLVKAPAGAVAGSYHAGGYRQMSIGCVQYLAHRVIWLWMTGKFPDDAIDHINGKRNDNRWINLREATNRLNSENQRKAKVTNKSGFLGVSKAGKKYEASIASNGTRIYLGRYDTAESAHKAYLETKRKIHSGGTL